LNQGDRFTLPAEQIKVKGAKEDSAPLQITRLSSRHPEVNGGETLKVDITLNRTMKQGESLYLLVQQKEKQQRPVLLQEARLGKQTVELEEGKWITITPEELAAEYILELPTLDPEQDTELGLRLCTHNPIQLRSRSMVSRHPQTESVPAEQRIQLNVKATEIVDQTDEVFLVTSSVTGIAGKEPAVVEVKLPKKYLSKARHLTLRYPAGLESPAGWGEAHALVRSGKLTFYPGNQQENIDFPYPKDQVIVDIPAGSAGFSFAGNISRMTETGVNVVASAPMVTSIDVGDNKTIKKIFYLTLRNDNLPEEISIDTMSVEPYMAKSGKTVSFQIKAKDIPKDKNIKVSITCNNDPNSYLDLKKITEP
ncbi:MAG: hypothetical protein ACRC2O_08705, partial [Chitinophagaceae bacterium]